MPLQPGETILQGKYRVARLLGEGGMAQVWLAEELTLGGRPVALKQPRADLLPNQREELLRRYGRERQVCSALKQARVPNLVEVYTAEPYEGGVLLALEYMPGGDLAGKIAGSPSGLSVEEVVAWALDLLRALDGIHRHPMEIVHRDVKPSNVLFDARGSAHLGDFGLAQVASGSGDLSQLLGSGLVGTPLYAAPEQLAGGGYLTPAADLFSLGCVLFEALCGRRYRRVRPGTAASSLRPEVPAWLDRALARVLAEDPWERFQEAAEMAEPLAEPARATPGRAGVKGEERATRPSGRLGPEAAPAAPPQARRPAEPADASGAGAVELPPYRLTPRLVAATPAELPAACDADWERAVEHFSKGFIGQWLRDGVNRLRAAYEHGAADDLEQIASRAEETAQRIAKGDALDRNAGLEEFLESLGAEPPVMEVVPPELDLGSIGVGEDGSPAELRITNRVRGYLSGTAAALVPWLRVGESAFGCGAGRSCALSVVPGLSDLPAGPLRADGLRIEGSGGATTVPVSVEVLAPELEVGRDRLDLGRVGQGETGSPVDLRISNRGRGYLSGRAVAAVPWLRVEPEEFRCAAGEDCVLIVAPDLSEQVPGSLWVAGVLIESNGGSAMLEVRGEVPPAVLDVAPAELHLGRLDPDREAERRGELTVRNSGAGLLTAQVASGAVWLVAQPDTIRCRAGEAHAVSVAARAGPSLPEGEHDASLTVTSNAGSVEVAAHVGVKGSLPRTPTGLVIATPENIAELLALPVPPARVWWAPGWMVLCLVPAGDFLMGSSESDPEASPDEKPQHTVGLDAFYVGRTAVTQAQYARFVLETGYRVPTEKGEWAARYAWDKARRAPPVGRQNHPVVLVAWKDAVAFCRWAQARLPTEAEWEKAARGEDGRLYPWGNAWDAARVATGGLSKRDTAPAGAAGEAAGSPYGCADMAGNVGEWCADWCDAGYYARSPRRSPAGPEKGAWRVVRGGPCLDARRCARCAHRSHLEPDGRYSDTGFRVVVAPDCRAGG